MMLAEILSPSRIFMGLEAMPKDRLLGEMARRLQALGKVADGGKLARRLIERENLATTGVQPGFAFPHAFSPQVADLMLTIGVVAGGADYESLSGDPVEFILLLLGPTQHEDVHLRLLARLSNITRKPGMLEALREAATPESLIAIFTDSDRLMAAYP